MKTQGSNNFLNAQRGVTLVELMVSLTIGMVIVMFLSTLYVNSRSSYRVGDDNARLQDEGRSAMNVIGRNLMQAGFGNLVSSDTALYILKADLTDFTGDAVLGCNLGFAAPTDLANKSCAGSGTSKMGFQVSYRVDNAADTGIGAGTDCNGQGVKKLDGSAFGASEAAFAVNRFFLDTASRTLNCVGNGNATVQPLLSNVDDMQITYGITTQTEPDANGFRSVEKYVLPSAVTDWASVISANVCLELSSPNNNVTAQSQAAYTGCDGTLKTPTDRRLHAVVTGVYTLRNNASVRNFSITKPTP